LRPRLATGLPFSQRMDAPICATYPSKRSMECFYLSLSPHLGNPDSSGGSFASFGKVFKVPPLLVSHPASGCGASSAKGIDGLRDPKDPAPEHGTEVAMTPRDVHDVYMVRKQLYISEEHEQALKVRARELGISEAALVRRMLDGLLLDGEGEDLPGLALRRHWRVSWRRPTGWRSPTASPKGMCSTGTSSTRIVREGPLEDARPLCGGHQRAGLRPGPEGAREA
jgi:hypothetical protein